MLKTRLGKHLLRAPVHSRFYPSRSFVALHWHFSLLQIAAASVLTWWSLRTPAPGYAVGTLAVLAAAMSIHPNMRGWQKALWMLLMGACLWIEIQAINIDRQQNEKKIAVARDEEREKFQAIADGIQRSIDTSQQQFNATTSRTNKVLSETNHVLDNVTGGDSYAVVLPSTYGEDVDLPLMIENHGDNVLTGVNVMITWQGAFAGKVPPFILDAVNRRANVGTIAPGQRQWLNMTLHTPALVDVGQNAEHVLCAYVDIYAQNFVSVEFLYFKKQDNKWLFKYGIYRQFTTREQAAIRKSLGRVESEVKLEEIDWTDNLNNLKRTGMNTTQITGIK